jgi:hypothetical protein
MTGKKLALAFTSAIMVASTFATVAQATQPNAQAGDYFGRSAVPQQHGGANQHRPMQSPPWRMPIVTPQSTALQWMEAYDEAVGHYKPTYDDAVILKRPLNQEVERVMEWSKVTAKIARNYRLLAKTIRSMPSPNKMPEAVTYRNNMADWYDDTAQVMEDTIRPCPPARTMEELEAALKEVHDRSEALRQTYRALKLIDSNLRVQYNVHQARHDDAILKYTTRDPNL